MADRFALVERHSYIVDGKKAFVWDQTMEEVNFYIDIPPYIPRKLLYCKIGSKNVEVGVYHFPPYFEGDLPYAVKTDCSFWTLEDETMHITLEKRDKTQTWFSPVMGAAQLDAYTADLEQKRLMLERFLKENPGFNFSKASSANDPRTSMGCWSLSESEAAAAKDEPSPKRRRTLPAGSPSHENISGEEEIPARGAPSSTTTHSDIRAEYMAYLQKQLKVVESHISYWTYAKKEIQHIMACYDF